MSRKMRAIRGETGKALGNSDLLDEVAVDAEVVRELGMEGREEDAAVADEHGVLAVAREELDGAREGRELRRADEDAIELARERPETLERRAEAVDLAAVRVALDGDVGEAEAEGLPADGRRFI